MSESSYFDAPDVILEHATFPHLTGVEWDALNRLAAITGDAFATSLMRSATPDDQRLAIHDLWLASSPNPIGEAQLPRALHGTMP